mmetsp:Transcript_20452/g.30135  ORF Transcript_20452/g.30135 Transcript_20452/m.30135 type:complete len:290 (-) Transcript_20452:25-894(-)
MNEGRSHSRDCESLSTDPAGGVETNEDSRWIQLVDEKSFSRLLYTNPVCFLTTVNRESKPTWNAMVISWLSTTNNSGKFMMSVNKRRHTASILTSKDSDVGFVLCVPVAGMEDLVLNVGKASGKWGKSKFATECELTICDKDESKGGLEDTQFKSTATEPIAPIKTSRQQKKRKFENGVDGLVAVGIGGVEKAPQNEHDPIAILGTVAHLVCKTYRIVDGKDGNAIDDDHHLILAEVKEAYVQRDYWNEGKNQFQPMTKKIERGESQPAPYLTFLGSQRFGYVVPNSGK